MRIETNATDRKQLANAISGQLREPACYNRVPSCTYSIGPVTVERDGAITTDDTEAWMTLMPLFESNGWKDQAEAQIQEHNGGQYIDVSESEETDSGTGETEETDEVDSEAVQENGVAETNDASDLETAQENSEAEIVVEADSGTEQENSGAETNTVVAFVNIPIGEATPNQLINLMRTLYARQKLINAMTQSDVLYVDKELITLLHDAETDTCEKVIQLVRDEIRAGMVRGIAFESDKLSIAYDCTPEHEAHQLVYASLFFSIVRKAFEAQHVSAVLLEQEDTEMKYFCNSYLMQLGYGGTDNKEARHILMDHLQGYAAFRNADKMNAHKQRLTERRHANRKAKEEAHDEADREEAR